MKNYLVLFFLLCSYASYSQAVKSKEITNKDLVKLIGSIESLEQFNGRLLYMTIFKVSNGSDSANFPESHEISHNLLLSVTEYDEYPVYKLFTIGSFFNPKVVRKLDSGKLLTLFIEHGVFNERKTARVVVALTDIKIYQ